MRNTRLFLIAAACAAALSATAMPQVDRAGAGVLPSPTITDPVLATLAGRELTINGENLGLPASVREVRLASPEGVVTVSASSPLVESWTSTTIVMQAPAAARTGVVRVAVDGQVSAPVEIMIFEYSSTALPGDIDHPLALAISADQRVWITEEFQSRLRVLAPGETSTTSHLTIPQVAAGIFATSQTTDRRTTVNILGEDIEVAADGSIWFTQGGSYLYAGEHPNTSRIVQYRPGTNDYRCYNVPNDNTQVTSMVLDPARGKAWYVLGGLHAAGNAIGGFDLAGASSDCLFDPILSARPPLCSQQAVAGCHDLFPLPQAISGPMHIALSPSGGLWFSEYWSNRIGFLDPDTGMFTELPLPPSRIRQGTGVFVGSGPATMSFDSNGDLWMNEAFDATVDRVRPSLMATNNCLQLDATNNNPCVEEIFVGSNGFDGVNVHTVALGNDGLVWFTLNGQSHTLFAEDVINPNAPEPQIGFIDTTRGNHVVLLPPLHGVAFNAGIAQDPVTGEIWFAEYFERGIGRLRPSVGDGDGIPAHLDNCPGDYNPDQRATDGNYVDHSPPFNASTDDRTWPDSDATGDVCDADDDNDGISDADEGSGVTCGGATAATDPLNHDSDGDRYLDGVECTLGTNPLLAASKPTAAACAALAGVTIGADTDGDKLRDYIEVCHYGTNPALADTDGDKALDGAKDGCEAASFNGDRIVNVADMGMLASAITTANFRIANVDVNKDGAFNPADQGLVASFISPSGQCPG